MVQNLKVIIIFLVFSLIANGCASIPPEAPMLSKELGLRIGAIEEAHINLLEKFFGEKREEIDRFVNEEWVPVFAEEVFSIRTIQDAWEKIVSEDNKKDRLEFLVRMGPKLQDKINAKRAEFIKPIDDLERELRRKIEGEYDQARAINNSLTSFLLSASKVAENRSRYMEMIGITDEKMSETINSIDSAISGLVQKANDLPDQIEKGKQYLKKIEEIKNTIL